MCLYPRLMRNKRYTATKKNGGVIPAITDMRTLWVPIGCQECIECRKQKSRSWQIRMTEEIRTRQDGKLVCLTFSNEAFTKLYYEIDKKNLKGYDIDNAIATHAMRMFNERWRKKYGKALRHWFVTELGHEGTEHIHMHGIIWTTGMTCREGKGKKRQTVTRSAYDAIRERWNYGHIWPRKHEEHKTYVNERTINYNIKYVHKIDKDHPSYKSIILTSPGIGASYTERKEANQNAFNGGETIETYRTRKGRKVALPLYWRNKIYSDDEKEALWIQKLDRNERWVMGEKVSTKRGMEDYWKILKWHQRTNIELGYGTGWKDTEQIDYENTMRELKHLERLV